ncbi:hypothetical protein [Halorussus halophilus]|uniref:hypothetical protein n=1 Tax=Halorussus halophilus TaxID=2650975 RepID=UPI001787EF2E|nr:hypothetical protein [Halorussus halophilus]
MTHHQQHAGSGEQTQYGQTSQQPQFGQQSQIGQQQPQFSQQSQMGQQQPQSLGTQQMGGKVSSMGQRKRIGQQFESELSNELRESLALFDEVSDVAEWCADKCIEHGPQMAECARLCEDVADIAELNKKMIARDSVNGPELADAFLRVAQQGRQTLQQHQQQPHVQETLQVLDQTVDATNKLLSSIGQQSVGQQGTQWQGQSQQFGQSSQQTPQIQQHSQQSPQMGQQSPQMGQQSPQMGQQTPQMGQQTQQSPQVQSQQIPQTQQYGPTQQTPQFQQGSSY